MNISKQEIIMWALVPILYGILCTIFYLQYGISPVFIIGIFGTILFISLFLTVYLSNKRILIYTLMFGSVYFFSFSLYAYFISNNKESSICFTLFGILGTISIIIHFYRNWKLKK